VVWLAAAVMVAGVVTGILAGLFGIGGGAVIVPVLFEVFRILGVPEEVRMQLCVGTSLAIIVPTTVRSYRAHRAKGMVIPEVVGSWAVPAVAGVAIGSITAAFAPGGVFKAAFVLIAGVIATRLLVGTDNWVLGGDLPGRSAMTGYGFLVGLASSLMGISGGSLASMVLTMYGKPIHNAVATSAPGRAAASSRIAIFVDRLRLVNRRRHDSADLELHCAPRGSPRACAAATPARNRVWAVSARRLGTFHCEPDRLAGPPVPAGPQLSADPPRSVLGESVDDAERRRTEQHDEQGRQDKDDHRHGEQRGQSRRLFLRPGHPSVAQLGGKDAQGLRQRSAEPGGLQ
jgi:uncharacterized membrane protein YfcA